MAGDKDKKSVDESTFAGKKTESYAITLPKVQREMAGEKVREAGIIDGIKSIRPSDFLEFHKVPCVREALLTGIGSGFGVGGLRAVFGGQ